MVQYDHRFDNRDGFELHDLILDETDPELFYSLSQFFHYYLSDFEFLPILLRLLG